MQMEEYYRILKDRYEQTDWNSLESIKAYNQFARELRKMLSESDD